MAVSAAWRRRALRLLHALGIEAATIGPGAAVLARRRGAQVRKLAPGAVLAADRRLAREDWFRMENGLAAYLAHGHVAALLDLYGVNCVLDVGANRGQYGLRLRDAGYAGHIASFEPVPETFAELERAAAGDPAWTAYPWALGREDGRIAMNVVPGTLSSLLPATRFGARRYAQLQEPATVDVPVRRLDAVLDEVLAPVRDPRPYLKLDTQGYDLEAFAGLGERAADFVGMQSEVALLQIYEGMPRMPEALAAYEAAGFEITALYPVSRQTRTARVLEFDCVMVRAGAR
ncbi:MAG TPA: FkbM family methyltransferase [Solirubrobacteraceae bacterium]|nr:FkbM family methyltransferase [Solirubrobacteraceae bacterium]